jgi:hypothetical protein
MDWFWNWGGECFGYREGDSLFIFRLAVDAVACELFSSSISLLTGNFTGNFARSSLAIRAYLHAGHCLGKEKLYFHDKSEQGAIRDRTGNNDSLILSWARNFGVLFKSKLSKSGRVSLFGLQGKQQRWDVSIGRLAPD